MPNSARRMPVLAYSLSGLAALRDSLLYIPVWIVVFILISVVSTVFVNMVVIYHAGQILINVQHYAAFDFSNLSDNDSLDNVTQIKDVIELGLPILLAYFTVIPIAVARSRLVRGGSATANIGFGQTELIVALNTLISFAPVVLFGLSLHMLCHQLADFLSPPVAAVGGKTPPDLLHRILGLSANLIIACLYFFSYVKTSLSLPYSAEENRLGVLYSWRATDGWFWTIVKIEALALVWAFIACTIAYGGLALLFDFVFEHIYSVHYSLKFDGVMDAKWFFSFVPVSVIFILFLVFTLGPIVQIYRFVRPIEEGAEPHDIGGEDPDPVTA